MQSYYGNAATDEEAAPKKTACAHWLRPHLSCQEVLSLFL